MHVISTVYLWSFDMLVITLFGYFLSMCASQNHVWSSFLFFQRHVTCIRACQPLLWGLPLPNSLYPPVASGLTLYLCSLNHLLLVHNWSIFFWLWVLQALDLKPNYVRAWSNMGIGYANQVIFLVQILNLNPSMVSTMGWMPLTNHLCCA